MPYVCLESYVGHDTGYCVLSIRLVTCPTGDTNEGARSVEQETHVDSGGGLFC